MVKVCGFGRTCIHIRSSSLAQASELSEWIHLIESKWALIFSSSSTKVMILSLGNFASLKKTACRIRIEETGSMYGGPASWRVVVFQILSEGVDMAIHIHEDTEGRRSLKDVLQRVFLESCQEEASL